SGGCSPRNTSQRTSCVIAASSNSDLSAHAGVKVSGLQASEVERTRPGELPNELAGLPRLETQLVRVGVLHLRELLHELGVFAQLLRRAEHHLMLELARVLDHEADGFALLDREVRRGETHGVG